MGTAKVTYGSKFGKFQYTSPRANTEVRNIKPRKMKDLVLLPSTCVALLGVG